MPNDLPIARRLVAAVPTCLRRVLGLGANSDHRCHPIPVPSTEPQGDPMAQPTTLDELRKNHFMLKGLPDTVVVPPLPGTYDEPTVKPLEEATVDDVAFALGAVESQFSAVADRLHALKKLYELARKAGALGADGALAAVLRDAR